VRRGLFVITFWILIAAIGVSSFSLIRHWLGWDIPQDIVNRKKSGWTILTLEPDHDGRPPAFVLSRTLIAGKQASQQIWGESYIQEATHFGYLTSQANGTSILSMSRRFVQKIPFEDKRDLIVRLKDFVSRRIPISIQIPPHWGADTRITLPAGTQATILATPDGTIPFGKPTPIIRYTEPGGPEAIIEITTSHKHPEP
jgi:hypothetical protein